MKHFIFILILLFIIKINGNEKINQIIDLKCEYLNCPLGVDVAKPRLSWKNKSKNPLYKQSAYQILISTDSCQLLKNESNLWNSGKTISDKSINIKYNGKTLKPRTKVYWKVRTWDNFNQVTKWSSITTWEMGLLNEEWAAKWISKNQDEYVSNPQTKPALYFSNLFTISNKIKKARAYITGLGYYELFINGRKIGDHLLAPNQSNYDRRISKEQEEKRVDNMSTRILYEVFDITNYLVQDKNIVSVNVGNGWYYLNENEEHSFLYYDTPRFIAQLEIELIDGSKKVILSDENWKYRKGPILHNSLFSGEVYDARLEKSVTIDTDLNYNDWQNAKIVREPTGGLTAQLSPPDRITNILEPINSEIKKENVIRYDFGEMISGWVNVRVAGKRGSKLIIKYYEDSGSLYNQIDTYILKGDSSESYQPRFTWHAFRFVDIKKSSDSISIEKITAFNVNSDVKRVGSFNSSNKTFNTILNHFVRTQYGNMHGGVPSDCPHRERRGYTGDGQIAAKASIYNLDMTRFFSKWINDIADAQNPKTGYVPNTAPFHSGGGGVAWGSAYIIIPWQMYLYYADIAIVESHYEGMKKWILYLERQLNSDGIFNNTDLGEWVPPYETQIPVSLVSSSYYYYSLSLMTNIAKILNNTNDIKLYTKISKQLKKSFNTKFLKVDKNTYSIGRQGANVFPLAFNLVPENKKDLVFESLVKNIIEKTNGHFDTGMLGTPLLLDVLTKYGRTDLAYTVMNRQDYPSYGHNILKGATTLWERWDGQASHSHPMFGSVCQWFFADLGGINPDPQNPGFKHTIIKPEPVKTLNYVNTSYESQYGEIKSNWKFINDDFYLNVTIPTNTSATVLIPSRNENNIKIEGPNYAFVKLEKGKAYYNIQSGDYLFKSKNLKEQLTKPMMEIPVIIVKDSIVYTKDSTSINIYSSSDDLDIRYTTDGSTPQENSLKYISPFKVNKSCVIKVRAFDSNQNGGILKTQKIVYVDSLKNGINYDYYEGHWIKLPNFNSLNSILNGKIYEFSLENIPYTTDKFAVKYSSNIKITQSGLYNFYIKSNDGSKLIINGKTVILNDGQHSFDEKVGNIYLKVGIHSFDVEYFQAGGSMGLELKYEGPSIVKQAIPSNLLFKENTY